MAATLGVSKSYYGDFIAGRAAVSVSRAVEWAEILGHSKKVFVKYALDDLLDRNDCADLTVEVKEAK
jgi:transcriptional regulator with XRE-family HTH domain